MILLQLHLILLVLVAYLLVKGKGGGHLTRMYQIVSSKKSPQCANRHHQYSPQWRGFDASCVFIISVKVFVTVLRRFSWVDGLTVILSTLNPSLLSPLSHTEHKHRAGSCWCCCYSKEHQTGER